MKEVIVYAKEAGIDFCDKLFAEAKVDALTLGKVFPDAKIMVSITSSALSALPKKEAAIKLVDALIETMKITTFQHDNVYIDFVAKTFVWNGRDIHVTPMERVALYYALIMRVTNHSVRSLLWNLRERVGETFLRSVLDTDGSYIC